MLKKIKIGLVPLLLLLLLIAGGCQTDGGVHDLTFITGPSAGTWLPVGAIMADVVNENVEDVRLTVIEGGGKANPISTAKGDADIGFSYASEYFSARAGEGDYDGLPDALTIAFYTSLTNLSIMVPADSNICTFEDLFDKRIGTELPGEGAELQFNRLVEVCGLTYEKIKENGGEVIFSGSSELADLLTDGHVDAVALMGARHNPVGIQLEAWKPIRIVDIPEEIIGRFIERWPGYIVDEIPAGWYNGQTESTYTLGAPTVVLMNKDVPEELAYNITKVIVENGQSVNNQYADYDIGTDTATKASSNPEDYHPGALRYFQEKGLLSP